LRFLLVDRILELESGKRAVGVKNVTLSEDFLAHHFPDFPLMPGTLIVESLIQLADWVIRESSDFKSIGIADSFERMKFHRMARPGDQLHLEVEIVAIENEQAQVKGRATCDGKMVAAARFTLAIQSTDLIQTIEDSRRLYKIIKP
jgi:3-hydroxyacyl-[acyl-carrier-protein] dehydratase